LDNAAIGLHVALNGCLGTRYETKTKNLIYLNEILGISRHLEAIGVHNGVPVRLLHSEGPEALNTVVNTAVESITRGLSELGLPNGKQDAEMKEFVAELVTLLDNTRKRATEEANLLFNLELVVKILDANADKHRVGVKSSGTKDEKIAAYRMQFIQLELRKTRQDFSRTRKRYESLRIYLRWYRVLYYSFRRVEYVMRPPK